MSSADPQPADDHPPAPPPAAARTLGRRLLPFGLLVVLAGSLWGAYEWQRSRPSPPVDAPAADITSPFLNTRPGVKYVGTARCADCHVEAATYAEHPMGRSVSPAGRWLPRQHKAPSAFAAAGHRYAVERKGDAVYHRETAPGDGPAAAEQLAEVAFAVGSGRQGQSFLVNRNGYLFQSPVSWYTRDGVWRLSPGYERKNEHFSRPVPEGCLFCHVNEARIEPHTVNRYRPPDLRLEPVGCERCHGPGELHVAARERGKVPAGKDLTIVNPRRLDPELREAVCQQCHLQGEARIVRHGRSLYDYRPGLPLEEFVSVYVRPPEQADSRTAVSHVEQMHLSRCFQGGAGKLGCTSCHDPHVLPPERERVAWYRGRCLSCHQEKGCALPAPERRRRDPADSCIACHMPRGDTSNVAHTAVTDHRIVRRPGPAARDGSPADVTLVPFHRVRGGERRDLGLALVELLDRPLPDPLRRQVADRACGLLAPAVEKAPDDIAALEGLGLALRKDGHPREALAALEQALKRAPRREVALGAAAMLTLELGEGERSVAYWKRLAEVSPHSWQNHAYLAQALAVQREWPAAVKTCRTALRLNPFETRTRMLLIDCLVQMGNRDEARAEFDALLALRPPQPDRLRRWFDGLKRSGG
jgi:cytochrome c-type biogenesis protein CcmH/NrfG